MKPDQTQLTVRIQMPLNPEMINYRIPLTRFSIPGPAKMLLLILILLPVQETIAQSGGFAGAFTRMGFGARGMAMGNAMGTVSQEGIFAHYNPALASFAEGNQVDMGTALMAFDRTLHSLNVTFPLPPNAGLNIGLLNANVYDIDGRTSSGYHTEMLSTHEFQLFAAFGIRAGSHLRLGVAAKLHHVRLFEDIDNSTGAGFDLGMVFTPSSQWRIGLTIQDIISDYSWNTNPVYGTLGGRNRTDVLPVRFRLSTSYFLTGTGLLLSSEFEIQRQKAEYVRSSHTAGSAPPQQLSSLEDITTSSQLFRIGAAWHAHERLTVRGGWEVMDMQYLAETQKISAGFSVHLPYDAMNPSIDYAFVREPLGVAGMHVLTLRLSL